MVTLIFVPMRTWLPKGPWVLTIAAVLSIGLWGFNTDLAGVRGLGLAVFMVGGLVLGVDRAQALLRSISVPVAAVAGVALFAIGVVVTVFTDATPPTESHIRTVSTVALGVLLSLTLSAAVLIFSRAARSWSFLALCGRRSLDIYLAHIILASGCRIILVSLGVHSVVLLVTAGLVVGVVGSLIVATGLRHVGLAWVFDGPRWLTRSRTPTPSATAESTAAHRDE
jgi:peptidoglycan/LPS O-acetylase OafA/YrhL